MKNNTAELVFILDRSGSMQGLVDDTIGGFNSIIAKNKEEEGKAFVTTVLFDNEVETLHDRVDLNDIKDMTRKDYWVRGCTALIDAIGSTIDHIENIHKYARPEDVPETTVFTIITDGYENASHKYSSGEVKKKIEKLKKEKNWQFVFVGANIDAVETAKTYGIDKEYAVDYIPDAKGTKIMYEAVGCVNTNIRMNRSMKEPLWREKVDEDYKNRK